MFEFLQKELNSNKGFTLVELLVVIAIIAIIALIAVPRLTGFTDSAKVAADEATAKTIENALIMYQVRGGEVTEGDLPTSSEFIELLGEVEAPQSTGGSWQVSIDGGNISVSAGSGASN